MELQPQLPFDPAPMPTPTALTVDSKLDKLGELLDKLTGIDKILTDILERLDSVDESIRDLEDDRDLPYNSR